MLDQSQTPILTALQASSQRPHAAFYAPGHKRGQGASPRLRELLGAAALAADLPELPELDNLFAPEGVILEAQELAAEAFGAEHTYFLANGSTCGIEAAILATCGPGEKIIVPRNAHRSVIAGLVLSGAMPIFVAPEYSAEPGLALGVKAETIATTLAHHPDARAVLLVSPTYHGICSEVGAIASLAHHHGIPLIIDEAHGPHFAFHPDLPTPALALGADLVVQSTHKVLGALSQAAMLHTRGDRIDRSRLQAALQLTQSTSPNSLLLASLDAARHQMAIEGKELLANTLALVQQMRTELAKISGLGVIDKPTVTAFSSVSDLDLTRLTVDVSGLGLTGLEADEILHEELGVTVELPELRHLTLIVSLGNTDEDRQRCVAGFRLLAEKYAKQCAAAEVWPQPASDYTDTSFTLPQVSPREAFFAPTETVRAEAAIGRISADTISAYPPGIPAIVAGEVIGEGAIAHLIAIKQQGGYVTGGNAPEAFRILAPARAHHFAPQSRS
ncbi:MULTISPECIES: aminotransferase class I/II-fold pyridoxal phosphate-dependent enzyme [Cyanophyceae]|uniref:aminotransferase class I/II-fold pyridoxal phosphate-dependent enzyme n=1 Tax=Cyanophyceae TaxID=3028117 RepID=UPI001688DBAB|nr:MULTISPECIES: aminotransferase class I/II-fold pyridoxal phosphate-dependent enzyme [Cyanophyceae]MBD1919057.1 aminotransferase class I/II-fold pyridoxal phosphate-dependent enzyme [Phormidium sp. FACHB-77]MBD2033058.1 aminotransferase class I/II-fold pyridoxal phosphate-dependent enzyme [Phormidium sp. FACHB-322]MBD2053986.1 aminotransferase class I/II-fold pyridoxal phosphate-dependent enzyme [Leptolyngbya sp. FACHB-60]